MVNETAFVAFPVSVDSKSIPFVSILEKRGIFASVVAIIDLTTVLSNNVTFVKRSRRKKS